MSNYSFNVVTIVFSTRTRPRWQFSTLFPTHGLPSTRHNTHTPTQTEIHTHQCRPTTWREGRNVSPCLEEQLTTTTDQELNSSLLFLSCFLLLVDAASQQVFFEMVLHPPDWLMDSIVWCTVCSFIFINEIVPMFCRECVFVVVFFCVSLCVRESACHPYVFDSFFPPFETIKLLSSDRISNSDA